MTLPGIGVVALAALALCAGCDRGAQPNTDPRAGIVWTVPNKTAWKQCDGGTMLWGRANKGNPGGRWVTATQPDAAECRA